MATPGLVSLKEHDEFEVAAAATDPRGWKVVSSTDGRAIGKVDDLIADPATMKVKYLDVDERSLHLTRQQEQRGHILLPIAYVRFSAGADQVTAEGLRTEDISRLPAYEALPVPPEYDEMLKESLHHVSEPIPSGAGSADEWLVARRDQPKG